MNNEESQLSNYMKLKLYKKCRDCAYYDASPFPKYKGKLAKCSNPHCADIGAGKIGFFTLASSECFTEKAGTK